MVTFRDLHYADAPLLLPNAWDLGSALAFSVAGFSAIGTTSFGVAASAGLPDGGWSSKEATTALAEQMCRMRVHVTADIEDGYSDDPAEVAEFAAHLETMGVVGINLEDSRDAQLMDSVACAAKIAAVKHRNPELFVNARVDSVWCDEDATVEAVLLRAGLYAEAGADGIFVPGLSDPEGIRSITAGIDLPVNVLAHPTLTVAELGELGIRRVSSGSLPYRAAVDAGVNAATALRDGKRLPSATPYWEMQSRLVNFNERLRD